MKDFMDLQGYELIGLDWYVSKEEVETSIESHVWVTAYKKRIPVREMSSNHINNCIRCFNNGKIPHTYLGGKEKWLKIFSEELTSRQ